MSTGSAQPAKDASSLAATNNPRDAAAAATAAAHALSRTKQARSRTRFYDLWAVVAGILLLAVVVYLLNILSVPVAILIWTLIIVFCLRGIVNGLEARGVNRAVGTTISYIVMAAVIAVVGFMLFSPIFGLSDQFNDLITNLPHYVDAVITWGNDMYTRYAPVLENDTVKNVITEVQKSAASWASSVAQGSATGIVAFSTTLANGLMALGFGLVIAFWILMELPAIGRETRRLIGPKHVDDAEFFHATFTRVMGGYIKGTILQCAVIGVGCGIVFQVAGVPNAAVLGVITGVLNIIPIIGPWLGGALAAIAAIFVSPLVALIALVATIVIQQLVYTFVSPKIMQNSVDIHPALMLMALMVGSALGGAMSGLMGSLVGMLASIPLVAVAKSVFVYYFEKKTGRHLVAEDGVFFKGVPSDNEVVNPAADATSPGTTGTMKPIKLEDTGFFKRLPNLHNQHHGKVGGRHSHDDDD
ncbi:AI-2E family transporter [uncultured Adlercreutzia sp.]|uniref:AI-2E family transporter n=1 Tax=uncultured Adlercreutzia sp. TaxID=875803 RepID=UPI0025F316C0|nr:AI-2E family transporter [uncultured Adlercreutzia sp.]